MQFGRSSLRDNVAVGKTIAVANSFGITVGMGVIVGTLLLEVVSKTGSEKNDHTA